MNGDATHIDPPDCRSKPVDLHGLVAYLEKLVDAAPEITCADIAKLLAKLPRLVPVEAVASYWGLTERELVTTWKRQAGAPQLLQVRQARYLVDVDEVLAWAKDRWTATEQELSRKRSAIRLAADDANGQRRREGWRPSSASNDSSS